MEETTNPAASAPAGVATTSTSASTVGNNPTLMQHQQQQQLLQQQLFLLHQYQQHHQQQQQQQPNMMSLQQQQAMSRFPSNIDAHLRPMRSLHMIQQQQQQQQINSSNPSAAASSTAAMAQLQQLQQAKAASAAGGLVAGRQQLQQQGGHPVEVEMAHQDVMKVCNPDVKTPFASIEDAVLRLLPYHVVSDYEAEEDDRVLDNDPTGQVPSRLQQWDHSILSKIAEFTTTFEKQVLAFNIMSKKRAAGEFRSEERLMIEQALLQEEKQSILEVKAEMESRDKANRDASEAKMRMAMAQAEHARAQTMARAPPMRVNAIGSHRDEGMIRGWGNSGKIDNSSNNNNADNNENSLNDDGGQRDDEEPSEDFLNDENEPEDEDDDDDSQEELDLNTR